MWPNQLGQYKQQHCGNATVLTQNEKQIIGNNKYSSQEAKDFFLTG